jgi:hypothetical protein
MNKDLLNMALSNNENKEEQKKIDSNIPPEPTKQPDNNYNNILDSIKNKDYGKKISCSFYLYESVAKQIKLLALEKNMKESELLNEIFLNIFNLK